MRSLIPSDKKLSIHDIALTGVMVASIEVAKASLFLPNVELVSLLIIIFSLFFRRKALFAVFIFIMIEGFLYGFGIWWISYLYIWPLLTLLAHIFRRQTSPLFWAILSGVYGLSFGALCAIPYFFIGGAKMAASYWIAGIPWDIVHCAGNFILALVLFKPLRFILNKCALIFRSGHQKDQ